MIGRGEVLRPEGGKGRNARRAGWGSEEEREKGTGATPPAAAWAGRSCTGRGGADRGFPSATPALARSGARGVRPAPDGVGGVVVALSGAAPTHTWPPLLSRGHVLSVLDPSPTSS